MKTAAELITVTWGALVFGELSARSRSYAKLECLARTTQSTFDLRSYCYFSIRIVFLLLHRIVCRDSNAHHSA